jgi:hypothetical protein
MYNVKRSPRVISITFCCAGAHSASHPMGTGVLSPRCKWSETRRCFIAIAFELCIRMCCQEEFNEVKVKLSRCLTKHHAMKTFYRSGDIAPRRLNLGTRWR